MTNCKSCSTSVDTCANISATDGPPIGDPTDYRRFACTCMIHESLISQLSSGFSTMFMTYWTMVCISLGLLLTILLPSLMLTSRLS